MYNKKADNMTYSGNILKDMMDKERERNELLRIKQIEKEEVENESR